MRRLTIANVDNIQNYHIRRCPAGMDLVLLSCLKELAIIV